LFACSVKSAGSSSSPQGLPLMNDTGMVYLGADQLGAATAGARPPSRLVHFTAAAVSLALAGALH
jgi:thiosulfate reductase cytochrome b subunit